MDNEYDTYIRKNVENPEQKTIELLIKEFNESIKSIVEKERYFEIQRKAFVRDYPLEKIKSLSLDDYVVGIKESRKNIDYHTFCYRIEFALKELGSMKGSTSRKFGIYLNPESNEYVYSKKWGNSSEEAFMNIKESIYNLLKTGNTIDADTVKKSKLSSMFKLKLLATYFPDQHLGVFNEEHLDTFIDKIGLISGPNESTLDKQNKLIDWKNNNELTKSWDNYQLMDFLYNNIRTKEYQIALDDNAEKEYDNQYPKKGQYNIGITINEWQQMLLNKDVFYEKDIQLLQQIYKENHHSATCFELSIINGTSSSSYNSQVVALAKRILDYTNKKPNQRSNGDKKYWDVVFWGRYLTNHHFEWKIKPKLAVALERVYSDLMSNSINEELDNKLNEDIKNLPISKVKKYEYSKEIIKKPNADVSLRGVRVYKRDRSIAQNALGIAGFKCELNNKHVTFIRKRDDIPYTESHHLIPMEFQDDFDVSIDVEENIVSLCSNCHNEIHYGKDSKKLIETLYYLRKEILKRKGIDISLEKLMNYYGY